MKEKEIVKNLDLNGKSVRNARFVNCFIGTRNGGVIPIEKQLQEMLKELTSLRQRANNSLNNLGNVTALPETAQVNDICKLSTDGKRYIYVTFDFENIIVTDGTAHTRYLRDEADDKTVGTETPVDYLAWKIGTTVIYTTGEEPKVYTWNETDSEMEESTTLSVESYHENYNEWELL